MSMSLNNFLENKCEDKLNSKFIELEQKYEYKLNSKLLWLELKYEEKIEELEEKYEEKINNKLMELEQKYEEKFNNKLIELEKKYEHKLKELNQMLNSKINDISFNCTQKNNLEEGKLELKLMVLEQNYENRLNKQINDIKNNMVTQGDLDDMSFHCAQINPNMQASSDNVRNSNHKFNPYYASIFMKCYQCVYDNNLCYSCRQHIKNISSIKLKNKNYMLIHSSMCGCLGYMNVNVIRINKQYYWLDIDNLILFNYTPISALEFHNNIQGIDVRVNTNKKYEKMICEDNTSRYFGFWDDVLPIIYEVGRIDKLTKKVTFHNYN